MKKFFFIFKYVLKGKSILRAYFNFSLLNFDFKGKIIDIGGGKGKEYLSFINQIDKSKIETLDPKIGNQIDFEKDHLPISNNVYDTVLFFNVMEHIFNYQHIANEVLRITKPGGQVIGYVPFLIWYHPDHRDFFRYTHESLEIIFQKAGASKIKIIPDSVGPFIAATQMVLLSLPRIIRPFIFVPAYFLDELFFLLKKSRDTRLVLGYLFVVTK